MSVTYTRMEQSGRLGNQLWQIAAVIGQAKDLGVAPAFEDWSYRPFFSVPDEWFGDTTGALDVERTPHARRIPDRARPYLQDLRLWRGAESEVRAVFQPSRFALGILDEEWRRFAELPRPICSVHVRLGDTTWNPPNTMNPLPAEWYRRALATLEPRGSTVIFSDGLDWCRENLPGADLYYEGVERPPRQHGDYDGSPILDWIDLQLQARCDLHVMSNSTYSWWGAWLSADTGPCWPAKWYGSAMKGFSIDIAIPPGWRKIR